MAVRRTRKAKEGELYEGREWAVGGQREGRNKDETGPEGEL